MGYSNIKVCNIERVIIIMVIGSRLLNKINKIIKIMNNIKVNNVNNNKSNKV
jgi:hypothetical protein